MAFALVAGCGLFAAPPASGLLVHQAVDGLVQIHWFFGVDTGTMDGTYATSSQLGRGTLHISTSANFGGSINTVLVRSDGMRMTGREAPDVNGFPNLVVNLTGTADIESASLTLTQVGGTHLQVGSGDAVFHLQGSIDVRRWLGYAMVDVDGNVSAFGSMGHLGRAPSGSVAGVARTPDPKGYWIVNRTGQVYALGDARPHGGLRSNTLTRGENVTSIASTQTGDGYWLFTTSGRVFTFGDATPYGDLHNRRLAAPIVGAAATTTGKGYYMVGADGGVFTFGDAQFHGSTGAMKLNQPVVGIVPTKSNNGYWLVAADGGVFSFNAPFRGSMGAAHLNRPIVTMAAYADGYLMVGSDGGVFDFSEGAFFGSLSGSPTHANVVGATAIG